MSLISNLTYACALALSGHCSNNDAPFANERPLTDTALQQVSGKAGPPLTIGAVMTMEQDRALADFRTFGVIGQSEMDIWWGTTGASMIAESVRAGGGGS